MDNILFAFLLALGFSAGVRIYVSFIDIFPKAQEALISADCYGN